MHRLHIHPGKKTYIFSGFLVLLIAARMIAPSIILKNLNQYLENFSPAYSLHIGDLNLHIYRMAYSFKNTEGVLKAGKKERFLNIERLRVSLAWRELLRGRVVADITVKGADVDLTKYSVNALSGVGVEQAKADAKNVKDETIPFDLERVRIHESRFLFSDIAGVPPEQSFVISDVDVMANNLTPKGAAEIALFTATGALQGASKIKVFGEFRPKKKPVDWSINLELKDFELARLNPMARKVVPVTFKNGRLSLFSAVQSVDNKTKGYVKPFMKDMTLIGDNLDFKNVPQFLIEIIGTISNFFLKNMKTHALATKVSFETVNGKTHTDTMKAIALAVKNAFGSSLKQSLDETLLLDGMNSTADVPAKEIGAQLGSPYVTEVTFEPHAAGLDDKTRKNILTAFEAAKKSSKPERVMLVVWSDKPTSSQDLNKDDKKLAEARAKTLKALLTENDDLSTSTVNMATHPSKLAHFLSTNEARVQETLQLSGESKQESSKAIIVVINEKNK